MKTNSYFPEGTLISTPANQAAIATEEALEAARQNGSILEAQVSICDIFHNMWLNLPCMDAMIPREEGAVGIAEGDLRDIALIARVGKPVAFRVKRIDTLESGKKLAILSRRSVQEDCQAHYLSKLQTGDIIDARVTHLEPFGAFVDIGCGIVSMVPIDAISVSRITHPSDRFVVGDKIRVIIKGRQGKRILLSHKELLGTWEENASLYRVGETTTGIVRSIEKYGVFIELMPNLAGLAELRQPVEIGQRVSVYIKSLIPEKLKVKLILVDVCEPDERPLPPQYFYQGDHIDRWLYTPEGAGKHVESIFESSTDS